MQCNIDHDSFGNYSSHYISQHENQFVRSEKCTIFIGSWNVNAKVDDVDSLRNWLSVGSYIGSSPDIVVVGLQEIVELTATNVVSSSLVEIASEKMSKWIDTITACLRLGTMESSEYLGETGNYKLLESCHLVGIFVCLFVKKTFIPKIKNIQTGVVPRGVGGVLGNKGGACIRMCINDTPVCFICAHLSAHREDVHKRNDDANGILSKKIFADPNHLSQEHIRQSTVLPITSIKLEDSLNSIKTNFHDNFPHVTLDSSDSFLTLCPEEHDVVYFFGDLNYRVVEGPSIEEVYDILELSEGVFLNASNQILVDMDQLLVEKNAGKVFTNFLEGKIDFKPTYQYIPGTDSYDRRPDRKLRCPGWCDRILWSHKTPGYFPRALPVPPSQQLGTAVAHSLLKDTSQHEENSTDTPSSIDNNFLFEDTAKKDHTLYSSGKVKLVESLGNDDSSDHDNKGTNINDTRQFITDIVEPEVGIQWGRSLSSILSNDVLMKRLSGETGQKTSSNGEYLPSENAPPVMKSLVKLLQYTSIDYESRERLLMQCHEAYCSYQRMHMAHMQVRHAPSYVELLVSSSTCEFTISLDFNEAYKSSFLSQSNSSISVAPKPDVAVILDLTTLPGWLQYIPSTALSHSQTANDEIKRGGDSEDDRLVKVYMKDYLETVLLQFKVPYEDVVQSIFESCGVQCSDEENPNNITGPATHSSRKSSQNKLSTIDLHHILVFACVRNTSVGVDNVYPKAINVPIHASFVVSSS